MYMDYSDIKSDIYDHLEELKEHSYPDDLIQSLADSAVPVYYSEIIKDWQEMPSEFNDSWQEMGTEPKEGILALMTSDLFVYYSQEYRRIWREIQHDEEQRESEELENA